MSEVWTSIDDVVADHLSLSEFGHGSGIEINTTNWLKSGTDISNVLEEMNHETLSVEEPRRLTAKEMDAIQRETFNDMMKANVIIEAEFNGSMPDNSSNGSDSKEAKPSAKPRPRLFKEPQFKGFSCKKASPTKSEDQPQENQDNPDIEAKTET